MPGFQLSYRVGMVGGSGPEKVPLTVAIPSAVPLDRLAVFNERHHLQRSISNQRADDRSFGRRLSGPQVGVRPGGDGDVSGGQPVWGRIGHDVPGAIDQPRQFYSGARAALSPANLAMADHVVAVERDVEAVGEHSDEPCAPLD